MKEYKVKPSAISKLRKNMLFYAVAALIILSALTLSAVPYTFSLYSSEEEGSFDVIPHKFYFESNAVVKSDSVCELYINNYDLSKNYSTYDITFTVSVNNVNVNLIDDLDQPVTGGTITGKAMNSFKINVSANSGVTDFTVTVETTNGFYKQLTVNFVNVSFDSDEGSFVNSQTVPYGKKATLPEDPTKSGFTFLGWSPTEIPADPFVPYGFDIGVTEDITLYAIWG